MCSSRHENKLKTLIDYFLPIISVQLIAECINIKLKVERAMIEIISIEFNSSSLYKLQYHVYSSQLSSILVVIIIIDRIPFDLDIIPLVVDIISLVVDIIPLVVEI